ncbi:hypothetical protein Godav_004032 [Gossypium davidsonii]|uniref:Uncharacterized protein n=1 Tax=Gossypium davidsonii TaxID=34287 RepID=A0A7J8SLD5_GOSDV|nr:hypothetical protein [Gossypium davidsonii]
MLKKVLLINKLNLWVNNLIRLLMYWNNLLRIKHYIFIKKWCRWRWKDLMTTFFVMCLIIFWVVNSGLKLS